MKDARAIFRINARIKRLENGNPGDVEPVGEGISEMRIDYGSGYRIYYKEVRKEIILLLCDGNKTTQQEDIKSAKKIAAAYNPDEED